MLSKLERLRLKRARIIAWMVAGSYLIILAQVLFHKQLTPMARNLYAKMYGIGLLLPVLTLLALYHPRFREKPLWRILTVFGATFPLVIEGIFTYPLSGGIFWWVAFTGGYGAILLLDSRKQLKAAYWLIGLHIAFAIAGVFLQPWLSFIPANPISHGVERFGPLTLFIGIAALLGFQQYRDAINEVTRISEEQENLLQEQRKLLLELADQRAEAEQRRAEAEAAMQEVLRLRAEEQQRAAQQAFLARYELLMRTSYEKTLPDFLRQLLEGLAEDMSMLGGIAYFKQGEGWQAMAAYAYQVPHSHSCRGGALETAAHLRLPYLIEPAPAGTPSPPSALYTPSPTALLYLPLYMESTQETIAVIELVLAAPPKSETLASLQALLPRLGTYLQTRQVNMV